MCNFPGPTGAQKCPSDVQLIDGITENLLFTKLALVYLMKLGRKRFVV